MGTLTLGGVTTTKELGQEQHEKFQHRGKTYVEYDYRHTNGELFTCCASSLHKCREKRDKWLKSKERNQL